MVAVSDHDEMKAHELALKFKIPRHYGDWRQMIEIERPDFVDIVTPPDCHEEMCAYAASRGVAIICQKPLAPAFDASRRIVEHAKAAGVRFMAHENWRWQPWYRTLKEIADAGTIGALTHLHFVTRLGDGWGEHPYSARQPYFCQYPRLLIYETGIHFIDTFRFFLGDVQSVFAQLRRLNPTIRGEDAGLLFLKFRSGATAVWDANRYNEGDTDRPRFTFCQLRIDGMGGHLTMDADSNLRVKTLGESARDIAYERADKNFAGDCVYFLQRHFVDCMLTGTQFESNGEDYLRSMQVMEAAYESSARSTVVDIT
jgi:predicted dehydrogenase